MINLSVRQLSRLLKHYSLKDGDILALKHQTPEANIATVDSISDALTRIKRNVIVVVVEDFENLKVLNEVEMNKRGWFRLEKLSKFIKTKEQ